jgi:hypothetical protein
LSIPFMADFFGLNSAPIWLKNAPGDGSRSGGS